MRSPRYDACLIDLSGTLHKGSTPIPDAVAAIRLLRLHITKVLFLTNTSLTSRRKLLAQLRSIGFDETCIKDETEIITAAVATSLVIKSRDLNPIYLIQDALAEDFPITAPATPTTPHNAVIVGLAPSKFNYADLNSAFRVLQSSSTAPLLAIHRAKYYKDSDGELSLGPGPFVTALEAASGKVCEVVGKPAPLFFEAAIGVLDLGEREKVVMVGDDLFGDIEGGRDAGLETILVRTGKFAGKDANNEAIEPTVVCDSIVDAVEHILGPEVETPKEFVRGGEPPLSPREEKMVKEIQALRNQLQTMDPVIATPRELFVGEPKEEEEVITREGKEEKDEKEEKGEEAEIEIAVNAGVNAA